MTADFDRSFLAIEPELNLLLASAMREAAEDGLGFVPRMLTETGQPAAIAAVNPAAFAVATHEGVPIQKVLAAPVRVAKQAISLGHTPSGALLAGGRSLDRLVPSLLADADRDAVATAITSSSTGGYTRMLNPPSCARCVVLAGKWFRWNEGFARHPRCDCRHIPASEDMAGDLATDPYEYFRSLSEAEQDRLFGKNEAQAIREGADIFRVVNTKTRGLPTAKAYRAPTLTLDEIYKQAGTDRKAAVELLTREGYILPGGQRREGVIGYGNLRLDARGAHYFGAGALGRGGTRIAATSAHRAAALTGIRDPLNRATMTAAERRLYDAALAAEAVADGRNPYGARALTQREARIATANLEAELKKLRNGQQPSQVKRLAALLGLNF